MTRAAVVSGPVTMVHTHVTAASIQTRDSSIHTEVSLVLPLQAHVLPLPRLSVLCGVAFPSMLCSLIVMQLIVSWSSFYHWAFVSDLSHRPMCQ